MQFEYDDKSDGLGTMYIKHHHKLGKFVGSDGMALELDSFALCPKSVKTGLGRYTQENGYEFIWDDKTGVPNPDMDNFVKEGYTKAFQCFLYTSKYGVMLWQRFQILEWNEWYNAMKAAHNASDVDVNKVAVFKYAGSEPVGTYGNYKPNLEFVRWSERPPEFVIPDITDPVKDEKKDDKPYDDIPF